MAVSDQVVAGTNVPAFPPPSLGNDCAAAAGGAKCVAEEPVLATLELADGYKASGYVFGASVPAAGELVFQTGMVGYPESLTDPSYKGQILVLTYPLVGNYGVPGDEEEALGLIKSGATATSKKVLNAPRHFESEKIHVSALVVGYYCGDGYSHYMATRSLGTWLQKNDVIGICGIDTRLLTKRIREFGSMPARIYLHDAAPCSVSQSNWIPDTAQKDLVARVSRKTVDHIAPAQSDSIGSQCTNSAGDKSGEQPVLRIMCVDLGMKKNQIRCLSSCQPIELIIVPHDFDFATPEALTTYDALFLSNGPGDPNDAVKPLSHLRKLLAHNSTVAEARTVGAKSDASDLCVKPIFGICLGHQLLALAAGAKTEKMKFGNRGYNIPCKSVGPDMKMRCFITSQNHGYAVVASSLPPDWHPFFCNANDNSNEGIFHSKMPYFSVQFHPESAPGPHDTEYLFQKFVNGARAYLQQDCKAFMPLISDVQPCANEKKTSSDCETRVNVRKVLILGSGGLSIGQAGEFDYSGSQAIKALKEEGIYTILINPNIATIQTSKGMADKVYFLPVDCENVRKVIKLDCPDGILVTFGGQTALNIGVKMKDEFESLGVRVLGTPLSAIETTEDRELFAAEMEKIGERCARSKTACNITEALSAASEIGYPVIARAAYTLGGLGSGFAENEDELRAICIPAFASSPQVLIEKSMKGWKEIEYEVVRDAYDNCITVCNMENFDPLGIHTGDSIVVSPSQTLSNDDHNMLRTTAINVIRHLGIVGECNIQYALDPHSRSYAIIEVNARLSRSSALASKATGYPLAFVAAKLALGISLANITNSVTKKTCACFEPSLDYCVVKIPRWDLRKFTRVCPRINSAMKSVGEVMSIGRTFEEAIQKAICAVDPSFLGFAKTIHVEDIDTELSKPTDKRLFAIANALHSGYSVDKICKMTNIDKWFINCLAKIVSLEKEMAKFDVHSLSVYHWRTAKQLGFSDRHLATILCSNEIFVREKRTQHGVTPFVKQIDTVAAEFPAATNYLYMTYCASEHDVTFDSKSRSVIVLGSGVYRIGSSVEFDWCAVNTVRTLRTQGHKTIMINYNPETVSTDYDEADRLYFETITLERVLDIYKIEAAAGLILSVGGQTPNNLAMSLMHKSITILGTPAEMIDTAENRYKFSRMLDSIGVNQPQWKELTSVSEAHEFCTTVGFPVLVRPSYVLSGAAMNVVFCREDLEAFLSQATAVSADFPVVISKFIEGAKEIELDAVAYRGDVVHAIISEHVENAGVHSGDATLMWPPQDLSNTTVEKIRDATSKIAQSLNVTGPFNIQFIAKDDEIKVIECNVRASRSFPFVSKATGVQMIELAVLAMLNMLPRDTKAFISAAELAHKTSQRHNFNFDSGCGAVAVKVPQFSFGRLTGADPVLGVEMASTGEVACFGRNKIEAYLKGLVATGFRLPKQNILLSIGSFKEKVELLPYIRNLSRRGYTIFATPGTADYISEHGVPVKLLYTDGRAALATSFDSKPLVTATSGSLAEHPKAQNHEDLKQKNSLEHALSANLIDLYINLPSQNKYRRPASYVSHGYRSRRMAIDLAIPLITNVKCAKMFIEAIVEYGKRDIMIAPFDYQNSYPTLHFGGCTVIGATNRKAEDCLAAGIVDVIDVDENDQEVNFDLNGDLSLRLAETYAQKVLVTQKQGSRLAQLLLIALHAGVRVHVSSMMPDDIPVVMIAKAKCDHVTCDISVHYISDPKVQQHFNEIDAILVPAGEERSAMKVLIAEAIRRNLPPQQILEASSIRLRSIFGGPRHSGSFVEIEFRSSGPVVYHTAIDGNVIYHDGIAVENKDILHTLVRKPNHSRGDPPSNTSTSGSAMSARVRTRSGMGQEPEQTTESPHLAAITAQNLHSSIQSRAGSTTPGCCTTQTLTTPLATAAHDAHYPPGANFALHQALSPLLGTHILRVTQFSRDILRHLFAVAITIRTRIQNHQSCAVLNGYVMALAFFEPSTRTMLSFQSAWERLGGSTLIFEEPRSSVKKGESFEDTLRSISSYSDCIVMRHPKKGALDTAAAAIQAQLPLANHNPCVLVNAGDGTGEHPTQALLDIFTIREELGTLSGLSVTFVGDLLNGRTVHSLARLLCLYKLNINFVSPPSLRMPANLVDEIRHANVQVTEAEDLSAFISSTDVLYVTRVQRERFENVEEYEMVKDKYCVDSALMQRAKARMIVMHPLPRLNEISAGVDFDHRAAYFRQMRNGLYVRMALLAVIMGAAKNFE